MDRKFFDMSDFYRDAGCIRTDSAKNDCGCNNNMSDNSCIDPLTMVFINIQPLDKVYPESDAFRCGTLFPNLNKPFFGGMR